MRRESSFSRLRRSITTSPPPASISSASSRDEGRKSGAGRRWRGRQRAPPAGTDDAGAPAPMPAAAPPPPARRRAGLPINASPRRHRAFLALTSWGSRRLQGDEGPGAPRKVVSLGVSAARPGSFSKGEDRGGTDRAAPHQSDRIRIRKRLAKLLANLGKPGPRRAGRRRSPLRRGERPSAPTADTRSRRACAWSPRRRWRRSAYIEASEELQPARPRPTDDDPSFSQQQGVACRQGHGADSGRASSTTRGEYETAIPILWRIVQEDRDNQDARSYPAAVPTTTRASRSSRTASTRRPRRRSRRRWRSIPTTRRRRATTSSPSAIRRGIST